MTLRGFRNYQGQALVEAAIVLPLIVFVTAILIELCLISNAKSVLRYSAFCAARRLSVEPGADVTDLKLAASVPLLGITGRSRDSEFKALVPELEMPNPPKSELAAALSPGAGFSPPAPMLFNKDLENTLTATWSRTFVSHTTQQGRASVEVCYFYHPLFPLARITQMIQKPWLQEPSDEMRLRIQNSIGHANYEQWRASDWLVLAAVAELPLEPQ